MRTGSNNGSNGASHDTSSRGGSQWETFHFSGGLKEYVQYNNRDNATLHEPICIGRTVRAYAWHVLLLTVGRLVCHAVA
jgi:DNA gyrase/topoisomerase IV subunit B